MVTPAAKRKAVAHLRDAFGMSERRACKAIGCCRMTMRYQTTRADDAALRQRMKAIAHERLAESDTRGRARDATIRRLAKLLCRAPTEAPLLCQLSHVAGRQFEKFDVL